MRTAFAGSILFLAATAGAQQPATVPAPGFVIDRWNTDAGLPQVSVNAILQTHDGYLWLATLGGIARFDGTSFVGMSTGDESALLSDRAFALAEDSRGNLWVGTEGGVSRISRGRVTGFGPANGMPRGEVHTLAADGETLWFGTNAGALGRIDGDSVRVVVEAHSLLGHGVPGIVFSGRTLWISADTGLFLFDGRAAPRLIRQTSTTAANRAAIAGDGVGGVWIGTDSSVLHVGDSGATETRFPAAMPRKETQAITATDEKTIWVGRFGGDVWRLRVDSGTARLIKAAEGGSSTRLVVDREGSLWVGNRVTGLARIRPAVFQSFTKADGLAVDNTASVLVDSKGRLWAAGRCKGVAVRESGAFRILPASQSPQCTVTIAEAGGAIWFGGTGIGRWRDGRYESLDGRPNAPRGGIHAIFAAKDGSVWVGGVEGVTVWTGGEFVVRQARDSSHHQVVESFYQSPDGAVWAGTTRGALRFDAAGVRAITRNDGLPAGDVRGIYQDRDGVTWFATYGGGLARYDGDSIQVFSTTDGLFDNSLSSITEDASGHFWISGNKGVFRVERAELENYERGSSPRLHCVPFGKSDGMASAETNGGFQPAVARGADGRLWFPTLVGIAGIDLSIAANTVPPPVTIDHVVVNGHRADAHDGLEVGPGATDLEVAYSGLSLAAPNAVSFRYRLEQWDADWVDAGNRKVASYSHLSPGRYRFVVTAANRDGTWNPQAASFALRVLPQFWQTWWFRILALLAIVTGPYLRVRQLRQRGKELGRLVDEKTAELRQQAKALEKQNEILAENVRLKEDVERISRHDLRTPLTSIISLAQIVREDPRLSGEHDASLQLIEQAGYRVLNMANLTLDLYKMEQGTYRLDPRAVDIRAVIDRVLLDLKALIRTRGVTCIVTGDAAATGTIFVLGDELLAHSMLSNLVKNAVEATGQGGVVTIDVSARERVSIGVHNAAAVPAELRERFFEKYTTGGKVGGTGLGAYSARLMAQTQGATIALASSEASGTTVTVNMRRADAPPRVESGRRPSRRIVVPTSQPRHILVVDDDDSTRSIIRQFLSVDHWIVEEAENGPLALRLIEDGHFDCVFMDVEMPVMDGFETVRRIRAIEAARGRTPVSIIALSSHDDGGTRDRALASGFDRYLTKPARRSTVIAVAAGEEPPPSDETAVEAPEGPLAITLDPSVRHLLPSFIAGKREQVQTMTMALESGDIDALRRVSHKMRGSLSLYGFSRSATLAAEIEAITQAGGLSGVAERLEQLRNDLETMARQVDLNRIER